MIDDKNSAVRQRIFNAVFLVGIFMSFSSCLVNFFLGLGTTLVWITLLCSVCITGLYILFRITGNFDRLALLVIILLSFVLFPSVWFANGGTYGSVPFYIIVNAGIIALLLTGRQRKIVFGLFALAVAGLIMIEYQKPEIVAGYNSELIRYVDLFFGLFICLFSIVTLIAVLIDSYMKELQKSQQYLATLEEKNRELAEAKEKAEELNRLLYAEKQKLQKLSITDYLTGAFNKRFITSHLEELIEAARNSQKKLTVAMIDIDNFKTINDTYGHLYGDHVLQKIAQIMMSSLRETDIIGRYGGDEFLIILGDTSREEGYEIIERIRQKVLGIEWENDLAVTISGGVIEVGSDELSNLLNKADRLLYRAKNKSKNLIEKEVG